MSPPSLDRPGWTIALVVFAGRSDLKMLRVLKPGFRHCFAATRTGHHWQIIEPMAHRIDVTSLPDVSTADLALGYRRLGFRVVAVSPVPVERQPAPIRPFTCVEVIKRLLGLRLPFVFTPAQLYSALITKQEKILDI